MHRQSPQAPISAPYFFSLPAPRALARRSSARLRATSTAVRDGRRKRGVRAWGVNPGRDEVAGLQLLPDRRRDLPEVPETTHSSWSTTSASKPRSTKRRHAGVRAFVVPGVGAEAGVDDEGDHGAARSSRARARRGAPRAELHGVLLGPAAGGVDGRPQDTTASGHVAVLCQSGRRGRRTPCSSARGAPRRARARELRAAPWSPSLPRPPRLRLRARRTPGRRRPPLRRTRLRRARG